MKKILFTALIALVLVGSLADLTFAQTAGVNKPAISSGAISSDHEHEHPPGFVSDGCTAFPDGNYRECCEAHDLDYFKGGSFSERRASDKRLYRCVKAKGGWKNKVRAPMMYLGVRVFGTGWLPTPFRWGFGKKEIYRAKDEAEKEASDESSSKEKVEIKKKTAGKSDSPNDEDDEN